MRILIALDAFKDGCSSKEACTAVADGIRELLPDQDLIVFPISDGGEGTVEVLHHHCGGSLIKCLVSDPLFRRIESQWLRLDDGTAIIEMAAMCGLQLLASHERNPMNTSTYGLGEAIRSALLQKCSKICITLGGSATNDLGMGMASALNWQFLDGGGNSLTPIGGKMIEVSKLIQNKLLKKIKVEGWADVQSPLLGTSGAAFNFAGQKGASHADIQSLEKGAKILTQQWAYDEDGRSFISTPGSGAAGGLGAGILYYFNGRLKNGFNAIAERTKLKDQINACDVIITGEGSLDEQSLNGKVVGGMAQLATESNKPLFVFTGNKPESTSSQISEVWDINEENDNVPIETRLSNTVVNLKQTAIRWAQKHIVSNG